VLLYHLGGDNKKGVVKQLDKTLANLTPFPGDSTRLNIPRLVSDLKDLSIWIESRQAESVSFLTNGFRLHYRQPEL